MEKVAVTVENHLGDTEFKGLLGHLLAYLGADFCLGAFGDTSGVGGAKRLAGQVVDTLMRGRWAVPEMRPRIRVLILFLLAILDIIASDF